MGIKQKLYDIRADYCAKKTPKIKSEQGRIAVVTLNGVKPEDDGEFGRLLQGYTVVPSLAYVAEKDYDKVEIYMGNPPKQKLPLLTSLKWLQLSSAGMNGYDHPALYAKMPVITNARGIYGIPIAEFVIGAALLLNKPGLCNKLPMRSLSIPIQKSFGFTGATVILCGLGDIGGNIAKRCKGMQCKRVIGFDKRVGESVPGVDEIHPVSELSKFVSEADYVISALPAVSELDGIFCASLFAKMKPSALFINVGRGNTVQQDDLLAALRSGEISGAVLDVSDPDPLPRSHPLRRCKRVFLSEHFACISGDNEIRLKEYYLAQAKQFVQGDLKSHHSRKEPKA